MRVYQAPTGIAAAIICFGIFLAVSSPPSRYQKSVITVEIILIFVCSSTASSCRVIIADAIMALLVYQVPSPQNLSETYYYSWDYFYLR